MSTRVPRSLAVLALLAPVCAPAGPPLSDYRPEGRVTGVIRSWGSNRMEGLMKRWEAGFRAVQPGVWFTDNLKGSQSAQLGLQQMVADLALMGRQVVPYDIYGVWRRSHRSPVEIAVATGSFDRPHKSFALAVLVNQANPIARITLKQLDGIYGTRRSGGWRGMAWDPSVARTEKDDLVRWGQLGLTGAWAERPIHPYGPPGLYPGGMSYFQIRVMGGADTWAEDLREYEDRQRMVDLLGADPSGIAYTGLCYGTASVKPLAVSETQAGPFVACTRATVADRTYPLTRSIYIYFAPDTQAGEPADPKVDPKVREFLRYVLSRQGQEAVAEEGDYLPLTPSLVRQQLTKIE